MMERSFVSSDDEAQTESRSAAQTVSWAVVSNTTYSVSSSAEEEVLSAEETEGRVQQHMQLVGAFTFPVTLKISSDCENRLKECLLEQRVQYKVKAT